MPKVSEVSDTSKTLSPDLMKQWLTELTSYTPKQIDTAIAQLEQQRAISAQRN